MNINSSIKQLIRVSLILTTLAMINTGHAAITDLSSAPLVTSASSSVKPNLIFILDDSGSMGWDYLPDWANDTDPFQSTSYVNLPYLFRNAGFNSIAYNPAITYTPPSYYNSDGTVNATTYPSQTSANTGAWTSVKRDGFGIQAAASVKDNLVGNAYFYTFIPGEYCSGENLRTCNIQAAASTSYPYSGLRWCTSSALTTCQALWYASTNTYPRYPGQGIATISMSGSTSTSVSGLTVNGKQLMSGSAAATTNRSTLAQEIVDQINLCTSAISGNCTIAGYSATRSSSTVTINSPINSGVTGTTPVVTQTAGMTITPTAFVGGPGTALLTNIVSGTNSYPYPNKVSKATSRTDCAGTTCTYAEEMTNYANWYAYYRTRMQMMKSSASIAFSNLTANYRVGYASLNNNNGSTGSKDFINISDFDSTQRYNWYNKVFFATPNNSTELRPILSKAGRMYAGKVSSWNGATVTDPMQYSCQQNFTILSTDGYWNGNAGYQIDGSTAVGNKDAFEPRPYNDGGSITYTKSTSQLRKTEAQTIKTTVQDQQRTTQIQKRILQLQQRTQQNQQRTQQFQQRTLQNQQRVQQQQQRTQQFQRRTIQYQLRSIQNQQRTIQNQQRTLQQQKRVTQYQKCRSNGSSCQNIATCANVDSTRPLCVIASDTYTNVSSCSPSVSGTGPETTCPISDTGFVNVGTCTASSGSGKTVTCQVASDTLWQNVGSCTASNPSTGPTVTCQVLSDSGWNNVGSCTASNPSTGPTVTCQTTSDSGWSNVGSCTASAPSSGPTVTCQTTSDSGWSNVSSCSPSSPSNGPTVTCQISDTGFSNIGTCTPSSGGGQTITCQIASDSGWVNKGSCSPSNPSGGPTVTCQTLTDSGWSNVSSCSASAPASGPTVTCQTTDTGFVNATSCSASSSGGQTITCQTTDTGFVNAGSCSASSTPGTDITCQTTDTGWVGVPSNSCVGGASAGAIVTCQPNNTGPTPVASCTASGPTVGNSYTTTNCTPLSSFAGVPTCTASGPAASNNYTTTTCSTFTTGPTTVNTCTAAVASAANSYTATTCSAPIISGGYSDTLADVAEYYYTTDLRTTALGNCTGSSTGQTLCSASTPDTYNNVPTTGQDGNSTQHMTTFTLGLGIPGYMQFNSNYQSATSGDFYDVKVGSLATATGVCPWQSTGTTCNWPQPVSDTQSNIDDLWHAAVNGRGTYFSAGNPALLITGLSNALAGISTRTGTAAAATTSNPNVTSGDNFLFSSTFTTQTWDGELVRQQLDLQTGVPQSTIDWAAQAQLDAKVYTSRNIYTYDAAATNKIKSFDWTSLSASEQAYFQTPYITSLSQFCSAGVTCLTAAAQTSASGQNLVNFIRGERTNEGDLTDTSKYYHLRTHLLGDIVNAEAVYVKGSLFNYADLGFASYVTSIASRQGMVYVAANDGMLHAFYAADATGITGGDEAWSYIPSMLLPNLYKLADKNYANLHQYYVDGTPVVGDICTSSCTTSSATWKTILVGGLNDGGRGYYALDITNPASPKVLWEFTNTNLGYSYGNPKITKLKNGTWVVMVTSGYNNVSPGDGVGRLFVLNAATGALITSINSSGIISTGYGDTGSPSGLAKISARVTDPGTDNTATDVYGGDMYGNVWRFDVNGDTGASGYDAQLLAVLKNTSGTRQPITAKPEVGIIDTNKVVFVGTGRYLGTTDLSDTTGQSFYAIKDGGDTTTFDTPRTPANNFVQQILTTTTCPSGTSSGTCTAGQLVRTGTSNAVDLSTQNGWYIDLPDSGERANTDPVLALGTLGFNTNVPNSTACSVGGYSYRYFLDFRTGAPVSTANGVVSSKLGNALATRPVYVRLPNNSVVDLTRLSDGTTVVSQPPIGNGSSTTRRTSWRELISE